MADEEKHISERQHKAAHRKRRVKEVQTKLSNLSPSAAAEAMEGVVTAQARKQVSGFTDFLREQSVVGVGIGLVFGIQIKAVVDTVMLHFINPITQLLPGGSSLAGREAIWHIDGKRIEIGWGAIVYSLLTFLIVAFIIYAAYKALKLDKFKKKDK